MFGATIALGRASVLAFLTSPASRHLASHKQILTATTTRAFRTTTALSAKNYLLRYDYIPEVLEKRGPHREEHLNLAKQLIAEGTCLSGGPTGEPGVEVPTGALFIFTEEEVAKKFVESDPYVKNGIVTGHSIEEWNVVVQKE